MEDKENFVAAVDQKVPEEGLVQKVLGAVVAVE